MSGDALQDWQMYTLPGDAPEKLIKLLERWQEVSKHHSPTRLDLPFEDWVEKHPGLLLMEPVHNGNGQADLKLIRVGPEHAVHNKMQLEGRLCSETLDPAEFKRGLAACRNVLETAEPHYWQRINAVFGAPPVEYCRLLLPLYDDNGKIECLMGSWVWKDDEAPKS